MWWRICYTLHLSTICRYLLRIIFLWDIWLTFGRDGMLSKYFCRDSTTKWQIIEMIFLEFDFRCADTELTFAFAIPVESLTFSHLYESYLYIKIIIIFANGCQKILIILEHLFLKTLTLFFANNSKPYLQCNCIYHLYHDVSWVLFFLRYVTNFICDHAIK